MYANDFNGELLTVITIFGTKRLHFTKMFTAQKLVLASTMVITVKQMNDACTEFFKTKSRPTCLKWIEL